MLASEFDELIALAERADDRTAAQYLTTIITRLQAQPALLEKQGVKLLLARVYLRRARLGVDHVESDYATALDLLEKETTSDPQRIASLAEAYNGRGVCRGERDAYDEAIADCQRALALREELGETPAPLLATYQLDLAEVRCRSQPAAAIEDATNILAQLDLRNAPTAQPERARAHWVRAIARRIMSGDTDEVGEDYNDALATLAALDPRTRPARTYLLWTRILTLRSLWFQKRDVHASHADADAAVRMAASPGVGLFERAHALTQRAMVLCALERIPEATADLESLRETVHQATALPQHFDLELQLAQTALFVLAGDQVETLGPALELLDALLQSLRARGGPASLRPAQRQRIASMCDFYLDYPLPDARRAELAALHAALS